METLLLKDESVEKKEPRPKCGIVMPISSIDGISKEHWSDVFSILYDVANSAGFEANLVSSTDEIQIIQKTIIQNLYNNKLVICDVSAKNPNVMFELGLRLAFDKPTIIIKDHLTDFNFDTSIIEHLIYPRDLRFNTIINFKETLKQKIKKTYERSVADPEYSPFLKSFGEFKVAELSESTIPLEKYVLSTLYEISRDLQILKNQNTLKDTGIELNNDFALDTIAKKMATELYQQWQMNGTKIKDQDYEKVLLDINTAIPNLLNYSKATRIVLLKMIYKDLKKMEESNN